MKLEDILAKLESRIPKSWAESWDNPGLSLGNPKSDISLIAAALDRPLSLAIESAVKNELAVCSFHTNWDSSHEGVNKILAEKLGLNDITPLIPTSRPDRGWGMGAVGTFPSPVTVNECVKIIADRWHTCPISAYGDGNALISKTAAGGGACGDMWYEAAEAGAQLFITSDMSYHDRQDALAMGMNLIITDHGDTERVSLPSLAEITEYETGIPVKLIDEPLGYKRII
ncbi:MAG: Nif3-like dinuclear metal center hexameric protein [Synergistaceae bacterium]